MAQPFNFDVAGTIAQQMQGSNALGELGRFMLQKKQVNFQQAQARKLEDRLKAQEDEKKRMAEATRAAMLGALTKDQEVPVFGEEEYADGSAQAPDISAMMMGMGGRNLSARGIGANAQAPAQDKPWMGSALPKMISDTMVGREPEPEPVRWEIPKSPVDVMRKRQVQVGTKTEKVANENWMGDAARAVAGVDPELSVELARTAATANRGAGVYTPEQKQIVDSKQQNRINLDRATASLNSALQRGDEDQISYWDAQVKTLKLNEQRMAGQLAELGVGGYDRVSPAESAAGTGNVDGGAVDLDKDVTRRREFMDGYKPKALADVPTESDIMADAMEKGFKVSRAGAAQIKDELKAKVQATYSDQEMRQKNADASRRAGQEQYDNWLKNSLPSVEKAYTGLLDIRNGISSALEQAKRSEAGGAYIAMKKVLGDALSGADFAGIAGFGVDSGLIAKIKDKLGGTPLSDSEAMKILEQAVSGFNTMLKDYEGRFDDPSNQEYVNKAKKAYGLKQLSYGSAGTPSPTPAATPAAGTSSGGNSGYVPKVTWIKKTK